MINILNLNGRSKGLNLFDFDKSEIDLNEKFDLIIISHVLEHMKNPDIEIQKIRDKLTKKDTLMYIEVTFYTFNKFDV